MNYEPNTVLHVAQKIRDYLSLLESAVIVEIPEERVRKDIEAKRIEPLKKWIGNEHRLYFAWDELLALAIMYKTDDMPAPWRKSVWHEWKSVPKFDAPLFLCDASLPSELMISSYVTVNVNRACNDIWPRIKLYADGLSRIEEQEGKLGGAAVFKETRLPVLHIGEMYEDGETLENLLEDFPELNKADVEFARLYYLAHPPMGRPRKDAGPSRNGKPINR